jgi:hypothetical protein
MIAEERGWRSERVSNPTGVACRVNNNNTRANVLHDGRRFSAHSPRHFQGNASIRIKDLDAAKSHYPPLLVGSISFLYPRDHDDG